METHQNVKIEHFQGFPRVEPVVKDNSCITTYKLCPWKYFLRYVLGYTDKDSPPYFGFGSAIHKYKEVLEITWKDNKESADFPSKEILYEFCHTLALKAALDLFKRELPNGPQVGTKWDFLTNERLKKTCVKMREWWIKEKNIGNIHVIATEQPFTIVLTDETSDSQWVIGGRYDQIIRWNQRLWGRDFKTSSKPDAFFSRGLFPNHQFILYTFSQSQLHGEQIQGQSIEMIYNEKAKGPEIYPHPVSFTLDQIKRWLKDLRYYLKQIDYSRENDHYPQDENHCKFCEFHNVCKMQNENGMAAFLKNNYKFDPWDYTKVRD